MKLTLSDAAVKRIAHAYPGNLGFSEMMDFQDMATQEEKDLMDSYLDQEKWNEVWELLKEVTGAPLEDLK